MITEDYVSFETAKLLKEKGFDKAVLITDWWYDAEGQMHVRGNYSYSGAPVYDKETCFNCPTLQMAMKWLRENFNMNPVPYATSIGWYFEVFDLTQRDITGCALLYDVGIPSKEKMFETYEEACDAAIRYCLENLI